MFSERLTRRPYSRTAARRFTGGPLVLGALACLAANGCLSSPCTERLVNAAGSPGPGGYNAVVLVRRCRGEQSAVTHVNLTDAYAAPYAGGDGRMTHGEVYAVEGERRIDLRWKGRRDLRVACVECGAARVFKKEGSWNDVSITYGEQER